MTTMDELYLVLVKEGVRISPSVFSTEIQNLIALDKVIVINK